MHDPIRGVDDVQTCGVVCQGDDGTGRPTVSVGNSGVVLVGWVVQCAGDVVAFVERRISHAGIIEHEVGPHELYQVDGTLWLAG